jgi:hypothetical protein
MKKYLFGLLICFGISPIFGQNYFGVSQEEFGKNRIQMRRFEWRSLRSNNFEFNYYRGGEKLAQDAIKIAENEYDRITELLGYTPFTTMKVFIYNNPKEIEQSNIGLASHSNLDEGVVNLAKSRVQIAYSGRDEDFKKEIINQIARLFVYDMLYGGSIKEVLQNQLLLTVPEWYMSGIAAYISENNSDSLMFDRLRTAVIRNKDKKLSHLSGKEAELIGQSIWRYIGLRYGKDNISNILNLTRIIRAEESSITSTLGVSYNRFIREWREYYINNLYYTSKEKKETEKKMPAENEKLEMVRPKEKLILGTGEIDTENYEFDADNVTKTLATINAKNKENTEKQNTKSPRIREISKIKAPIAYNNLMNANQLKMEFFNDPVRRGGVRFSETMNDLLENHQINLSLFITPVLKNHDIHLSYKNLSKKVDWGFDIERRSIALTDFDNRNIYLFRPLGINRSVTKEFQINRRLYYNRFAGIIASPITQTFRVSISPNLITTTEIDYEEFAKAIDHSTLGGYRAEAVFDNTKTEFMNILLGTRAKIRYDKYYGKNGFSRFVLDARHYERVLNTFILAGRISYSRSLGNSPKYTLLGGVENWVFRTVYDANGQGDGIPRDLRDILFYDFAGDLRGFNYAKIYGTSHLLTNIELRLPLSQFISKGTATSNFVRNLQFVGFSDIGTAWNGKNGPFSRQNSQNTEIIGGGSNPFRAEVTNFRNPFLIGYGLGARTTVLGLQAKLDYAWGLEDKEVNKPITYISLGYNF